MPRFELQPQDTIDRDAEQELFSEMLLFTADADARLLMIKDKADSGKTALLRRLDYNCKYVLAPRKAVCLIEFADEKNAPKTAFDLVNQLVTVFSEPDWDTFTPLDFSSYSRLNNLRLGKSFAEFTRQSASYRGKVDARGAHVTGEAILAGTYNKIENPKNVYLDSGPWDFEQQAYARRVCIEAFFEDLKSLADQQEVILLMDSFESCERDLKKWIMNKVVSLCLVTKKRPNKFVVVLAGRELPTIQNPNYANLIVSRDSLSGWSQEHLKAFLRLHGYEGLMIEEGFQYLWAELRKGRPIGRVLPLIEAMVA